MAKSRSSVYWCIWHHTHLNLYCWYEYTRPYMINRILSLKQLWLLVNSHAWFHLHGLRWPVRNGEGAKNSKWNYMFPAGFELTPRQSTTGKSAPKTARPRWLDIKWSNYSLTVFWNGYVKIPVWNWLWFDTKMQSSVNNYYTGKKLQWEKKWKFSLTFREPEPQGALIAHLSTMSTFVIS